MDPGAVPGTSTNTKPQIYELCSHGGDIGLTGISKDGKAVFGEIPPLSVQLKMNANDNNVAPVAMAA